MKFIKKHFPAVAVVVVGLIVWSEASRFYVKGRGFVVSKIKVGTAA